MITRNKHGYCRRRSDHCCHRPYSWKEYYCTKQFHITEAQIFLTRECNNVCTYCKLTQRTLQELSLIEWQHVFDNLWCLGIRTIKLLGGEPTMKPWLPELIAYGAQKGFKVAVLSNSLFDDTMRESLNEIGLFGYFASVDTLYGNDREQKSQPGYEMLCYFKEQQRIPVLAANIVLHKQNIYQVPLLIEKLSDEGFFCNVCSIQHTTLEKEFTPSSIHSDYIFHPSDQLLFLTLISTLLSYKRQKKRLSVSQQYIEGLRVHGIMCDWQCIAPTQLRIDADGGLMLCPEFRTELSVHYNATSLSYRSYQEFLGDWRRVRQALTCDGCYWSSVVESEINAQHERQEFAYSVR